MGLSGSMKRSLTPAEEPVVPTPVTRVVRSRVIKPGNRSLENTEAGTSSPTYPETRYQQPILDGGVKTAPADHHSIRSKQRSNSGLRGPHPSGPASLHNLDTAEENASPPSTHRAHPSFLNPDLACTHRTLKRQGISLLSSLEKLAATLEALEPDPEAMEWVRSTGTVCYVPYQFPAQNFGQAVPEAGGDISGQNCSRSSC
ncbi:hypothetical protein GJ744_006090 [Endocarpon pusillum]|uniref:Uncharacterized protein n=1 Tax=Endocarpon pusillum TaxID=364733 RepID=A0A8H7ANN5_9EURO|nr:hypothetical protein GJ744_006090 [Endocarpon pusillum]